MALRRRCFGFAAIRAVLRPQPQSPPAGSVAQLRCFAAPVQTNPKPKPPEDGKGTRLNAAITAPFVRLVTDDGHSVVSRTEALQLARRLDLDLVEVQKFADPPVCKIMDFHKEKYKKETKEKERAKDKCALTLRTGDCKEVRFKGKTETNDLKVKADGVIKLMEKGYRVKCIAKGGEGDNLEGLLSRLLALIEDSSVIESGPHFESRQAYVIVRHSKFATKKSGKKASKEPETNKLMRSATKRVADDGVPEHEPKEDLDCEETEIDSEFGNSESGTAKTILENFQPLRSSQKESHQPSSSNSGSFKSDSFAAKDLGRNTRKSPFQDVGRLDAPNIEPVVETNRYAVRSGPRARLNQLNLSSAGDSGRFQQPKFSNERHNPSVHQPQFSSGPQNYNQPHGPQFNNNSSYFPSQSPLRHPGPGQLHQVQFNSHGKTLRSTSPEKGGIFQAPDPLSDAGAKDQSREDCSPTDLTSKSFGQFSLPRNEILPNPNISVTRTSDESVSDTSTPKFGTFSSKRPT